jgi:hypothetical protein
MTGFELYDVASWWGRPVARRILDARPRSRVVVTGTIRITDTIGFGASRAYRCTLDDGTGAIDAVFVGRREIAGPVVGVRCGLEGTVQGAGRRLVVWNPIYRLESEGEMPPTDLGGDPRLPKAVPMVVSSRESADVELVDTPTHGTL